MGTWAYNWGGLQAEVDGIVVSTGLDFFLNLVFQEPADRSMLGEGKERKTGADLGGGCRGCT